MLRVRKAGERGHADHGWLNTYHTFSFASYYDPAHNGFRALRVINEDRVAPGNGFGTHPHKDMEIISYVISGSLEHSDSRGNGTVIRRGEIQRMSAGAGVTHSEQNHSGDKEVHFLQIWITPEKNGITPGYEQSDYAKRCGLNELCLIVSRNGRNGSVRINQDVDIYTCTLSGGKECAYPVSKNRHQWVQVVSGDLSVNGTAVTTGDGCAVSKEDRLKIEAESECEFLLIDMG